MESVTTTDSMNGALLAEETHETRKLSDLPTAINFRDVAELAPEKFRSGVLYRSSEIFKLELLADYGIRTLLDLRRKSSDPETHEVYQALSSEADNKAVDALNDVTIYHYDMIGSSVKLSILTHMPKKIWWKLGKCFLTGTAPHKMMCSAVADPNYLGFKEFYKILVDKAGSVMAETMRVFADASNFPVLFHCTHGKDRAGIVCCLLALLLEIPSEVICQDYVQSGLQLKAAKDMYELPLDEALLADAVISAPYDAMESLIAHLENTYGGVVPYLMSIGLTQTEISSIRKNIQK